MTLSYNVPAYHGVVVDLASDTAMASPLAGCAVVLTREGDTRVGLFHCGPGRAYTTEQTRDALICMMQEFGATCATVVPGLPFAAENKHERNLLHFLEHEMRVATDLLPRPDGLLCWCQLVDGQVAINGLMQPPAVAITAVGAGKAAWFS